MVGDARATTRALPTIKFVRQIAGSNSLHDRRAFALCAMHYPARRWIDCIAPVHRAPVIPDEDVPEPPLVMPREVRLRRVSPQ
jgi:hypothetical protein